MDSLPPAWNPIKFNTSAFQGKIYLTKQEADGLYLSITSGRNLGLIDGITPGIVLASKAVIVDSSKNIIGFNNITLTNSLTLSSLTSTISLSSTLSNSISTSGGISVGGTLFGTTQASYLTSITTGIAQANKALILDSSANITSGINSLTSSNLLASSNIRIGTSTDTSRMLSMLSSSQSIGSSNYAVSLGQSNTANNQAELSFYYAGSGSTSNRFEIGFAAKLPRALYVQANGFIGINKEIPIIELDVAGRALINNTSSASTLTPVIQLYNSNPASTIDIPMYLGVNTNAVSSTQANFGFINFAYLGDQNTTSNRLDLGLGFTSGVPNRALTILYNKNVGINNTSPATTLEITGTIRSSGIGYINTPTTNSLGFLNVNQSVYCYNNGNSSHMQCFTDGMLQLGANSTRMNWTTTGQLGLALTPRLSYIIDCGTTMNSQTISLFSNGTYASSIGFNDNLFICTGNNKNINFYNNATTTTPQYLLSTIYASGALDAYSNIISKTAGIHAYGSSIDKLSTFGNGIHMDWAGSGYNEGRIFSYNYSSSTSYPTRIQGVVFDVTNYTGIYLNLGVYPSYPLDVASVVLSYSGSYGYLNSSGNIGTGTNTGSVNVSARFQGRIFVQGEIDVLSDIRFKKNIEDIDEEEVKTFMSLEPKKYELKRNGNKEYGYIAQDIAKAGLHRLVQSHKQDNLPEYNVDGFHIEANTVLTVEYNKIVCLLHKQLKASLDRIKKNETHLEEVVKSAIAAQEAIAELRALLDTKADSRKKRT